MCGAGENSEGVGRLMLGVRPLLFCRWLCVPLACDGRRVPGYPRCAGRVFDHYVNLGSSPLCGACVEATLDKRVIPAVRGFRWRRLSLSTVVVCGWLVNLVFNRF